MDFIKGVFVLAIIVVAGWGARTFFELVGGWPGVVVTVIVVVALFILGRQYFARRAKIRRLKEIPDTVRTCNESARDYFTAADIALKSAHVNFEEESATLFWEKYFECEKYFKLYEEWLQISAECTETYNNCAPTYNLTEPMRIESLSPVASKDIEIFETKKKKLYSQALKIPHFDLAYGHAKERMENKERHEKNQENIENLKLQVDNVATKQNEAIRESIKARQIAEDARSASKRAAGDWF